MLAHRFGIDARRDDDGADATSRADGTEQVIVIVPAVAYHRRTRADRRSNHFEEALPNPGFFGELGSTIANCMSNHCSERESMLILCNFPMNADCSYRDITPCVVPPGFVIAYCLFVAAMGSGCDLGHWYEHHQPDAGGCGGARRADRPVTDRWGAYGPLRHH